jgi:BlaI family transcriptional regulator, penicillinase repressor
MTGKKKAVRLSAGELELLDMLWRERSVTILEAQQALGLPIGYTTVQTRLNRLVAKGVAARSAVRPAKYSAAISPGDVGRGELDRLVERVSQGRVTPLVAHLLQRHALSADEIAELKELVAEAERKARRQGKEKERNK